MRENGGRAFKQHSMTRHSAAIAGEEKRVYSAPVAVSATDDERKPQIYGSLGGIRK